MILGAQYIFRTPIEQSVIFVRLSELGVAVSEYLLVQRFALFLLLLVLEVEVLVVVEQDLLVYNVYIDPSIPFNCSLVSLWF